MFSSSQRFIHTLFGFKTLFSLKTLKSVSPKSVKGYELLIPALLFSLSVFSVPAFAEESANGQKDPLTTVYKIVGPDGSVTFSDQPAAQSETLLIEPVPTVPALKPEKIAETKKAKRSSQTQAIGYSTLNILSPSDQSAFNSGSGDLSVLLEISPALASGDQIELRMDQKLIDRGNELEVSIPNVDRGTHTLQARIVSSSGQVLKEANSSFTMHRPSTKR